ncbi:MAG: alcohol dehydrogenase catalytic domain-containing protein, partial [Alphaproteobacteria bacterium]
MTEMMRLWQSSEETGISALRQASAAIPEPGENEVLVRVEAAALNFSDLLMIDGIYQIRPDRPFTPGQEIAGVVVAAGSASGFAQDVRVAGKVLWGGFAEYAILRADMAIALPDGIGATAGVALPVVYTT